MNFFNNVNIRLLPEVNYLYPSTKYMKWTFTQNSEVNDVLLLRVKVIAIKQSISFYLRPFPYEVEKSFRLKCLIMKKNFWSVVLKLSVPLKFRISP